MNWFQSLIRLMVGASDPRGDLYPDLGVMRLETRRVLNGDGVISELVIDAGVEGDDGQSDAYHVRIDSDQIEVSFNGELIETASTERFEKIRLLGSTDDDTFTIEIADQSPSSIDVSVDGGGGNDVLELTTLDRIERLLHALEDHDSGNLESIDEQSSVSVRYDGISLVNQQVVVDALEIHVGAEFESATLTGGMEGNRVTATQLSADGTNQSFVLAFINPADSLSVATGSEGELAFGAAAGIEFSVDGLSHGFEADFVFAGDANDQFSLVGETQFESGEASVTAGSIRIESSLLLSGSQLQLNAFDSIELSSDGAIVNQGGEVFLDSGDNGQTTVHGLIDVSDQRIGLIGGDIRVLGASVDLTQRARLDASGHAGGGTVLVGGDYQGRNNAIRNATQTRVLQGSVIKADALQRGDGGRVILWSDGVTEFLGSVMSLGGSESGDGGFVEISGKQLGFSGFVDTRAANGESGQLLIDPINIVVGSGSDVDTTYYTAAEIVSLLESNHLTLQADNDITFEVGFSVNSDRHDLTLVAGRSITIQQDIRIDGRFIATVNDDSGVDANRGTGNANFTMEIGVDIFTNAHNEDVTITMANGFNSGGKTSGDLSIEDINVGSGTLTITNNGETNGSDILRTSTGSEVFAEEIILSIDDITAGDGITNTSGVIGVSGSEFLIGSVVRLSVLNDAADVNLILSATDTNGLTLESAVSEGDFSLQALAGNVTVSGSSVSSTAGDFHVTSSGTIRVDETVTAASGNVLLDAGNALDINASISGDTVSLVASNNVDVANSQTVVASGASVSVQGGSVRLRNGSLGSETVANSGAGSVSVSSTSGNVTLHEFAIGAGAGTVDVNAGTNSISVNSFNDDAEINSLGEVSLTASTVGSFLRDLELLGANALTINDTGGGDIGVAELNSATILETTLVVTATSNGSIDVAYSNSDEIQVDSGHQIARVDHDEANREFHYTATTGSVFVDEILAGNADVSLTATAGAISDANNDGDANITTTGAVAFTASSGIGTSGNAFDLAVGEVSGNTATSGVFLTNTSDLIVGSSSGVSGLQATTSGNIELSLIGSDLQFDQAVSVASGNFVVNAADVTANASVSADSIDIDSTGTVTVAGGHAVVAGGNGTSLEIDALTGIVLGSGGDTTETLRNAGTGVISLGVATASQITLGDHAVRIVDGLLTLDAAANGIVISENTGSTDIVSGAGLVIEASSIGTSGRVLEIDGATSLSMTDTGAGDMFLAEVSANTIAALEITVGDDGYGGISMDYFNSDQVQISDGHAIGTVVHHHSDRRFEYVATSGNVTVGSIATGSANITLTASAGSIDEVNDNSTTNFSTSGTLTLSASSGIGADGANGLDVDAGTIAAQSSGGNDISLVSPGAMTIGLGENSVNGVSVGSGGNVTLEAGGTVQLNAGSAVTSGGDGTSLSVQGTAITLVAGSSGAETLRNAGTGSVSLTATSGDVSLEHHSVSGGTVSINAMAQQIIALQASGTSEINTTGDVTLTGAAIGSAANSIEIAGATALSLFDTGAGATHITELSGGTILSTAVTVGDVGFGSIDIVYNDADLVDINDGHSMTSVVHLNSNRDFEYTATDGNVSLAAGAINAGSGDVTLVASLGSISESIANTSTDITTSGILTLRAATGVGSSSANDSIDTVAGTIAIETLSGGIFLNEFDGLVIGSGNGVDGLTTSNSPIVVRANGALVVNEDIQGSDIDLFTTGTFSLGGAADLIAGGTGTTLSIEASTITLIDGSSGDETIRNTDAGAVTLIASTGEVRLGTHSVASGSGTVSITAATDIDESANDNTVNVTTSGLLVLNAAGPIGQSGGAAIAGSGPLDVAVGSLEAHATAAGGIFIKDTGGLTLTDIDTVSGDIEVLSDDAITVTDLDAVGTATISGGGDVTLGDFSINAGTFDVSVTSSGLIEESSPNATTKITTTGNVFLSGATGVGTSGGLGALDVSTSTLSAASSSGGVFLSDPDGVTVGDGTAGITTSGGAVQVASSGGTLLIDDAISAGAGNIILDGSLLDIDADVSGGSIDLDATNGADLATGIQVSAGGDGTALTLDATTVTIHAGTSGQRTVENTGSGTISITASSGPVALGIHAIEAGSGEIEISSATTLSELVAGDTTSIESTGLLTLNAGGGIGSTGGVGIGGSGPLDTAVAQLNVNSTSADGVFLKNGRGLDLLDITSTSSAVEVRASGAMQVTNIDTAGAVTLVASTGNIALNDMAIDAQAGTVLITASAGSINELNNTASVNITTTGELMLSARDGIGTTSSIDTDVGVLAAQTTSSGGIAILQSNALNVGNAGTLSGLNANGGNIAVESSAGLVVSETVNASAGNVDLDGTSVDLNASVSGNSIDVDSSGTVTVDAGVLLTGGGAGTMIEINANTINLAAGSAEGAEAIRTSDGSVSLTAASSLSLPDHAISTGSGAVSITSTGGAIAEASVATERNVATTGLLSLSAFSGIGASGIGNIDTDVGTLAAQVTNSGGIFVSERDALILGSGGSGVTTNDGAVSITAGGNVRVTQLLDAGSGTVTLTGDDFDIDAGVRGGNIGITSDGTLEVAALQQVIGGGGSTLVSIQAQDIRLQGGSAGDESIKNTANGSVAVTVTTGDFLIQDGAIGVDNGSISITASAGAIAELTPGTATSLRTTGTLTLDAQTGIGGSGTNDEIDTQVGTIAARTTSGGVFLRDVDDLTIGAGFGVSGVTSTTGGAVSIVAGSLGSGNLLVSESINAGDSAVVLEGTDIDVDANVVGNSIDIDGDGDLDVANGVQISATGTGTVLSIEAGSIELGIGSSTATTVQNNASGTITLSTTAGDLGLNRFSVGTGSGDITLDTGSNSINIAEASGVSEVTTTGTLSITAAAVGDSANHLDVSGVTALVLTDTGPGEFFITELDASTIASTSVSVGDNGFGTINVNYFAGDDLDVAGDHIITLTQGASGRAFDYVAGSGDIRIDDNGVDAGAADVRIVAQNGSITELNNNSNTNIRTSGTLTLSATDGIGVDGEALDTDVGTIALGSVSGGIFVNELSDLAVGVGNGVIGLSVDGDIGLTVGGALVTSQAIAAGSGSVSLVADSMTFGADVTGQNIGLNATGGVVVSSGSQLIGGGSSSAIEIVAAGISIGSGASGNESIRNTGTGTVALQSTGNITLDQNAIATGAGAVSLDAGSNSIIASAVTGVSEVDSLGTVSLIASTIGSSTNRVDLSGSTELSIHDRGVGEIFLSEIGTDSIGQVNIVVDNDGFGGIDLVYSNGDFIDIDDSHLINTVAQSISDRGFDYTAGSGDIRLADPGIDTGSAALSLTTSNGAIVDFADTASTKLTTSGILTLSATSGIGSALGDGALDTAVGTIAAQTGTGGLFVIQSGELAIGTIAGGIGLDSSISGDVSLEASGDVTAVQAINASSGSVSLSGGDFSVAANITASDNLTIDVTGDFDIQSGHRVIAGGTGTALTIEAGAIVLGAGSLGNATVSNSGDGSIGLTTAGGNIAIGEHGVESTSGDVAIDAGTGNITVAQATGGVEISTVGALDLVGASIGSSAEMLEFEGVSALTISDTGAGAIHLTELTSGTVASTAITVASAGSGTIDVDYFGSDLIDIDDNHSIRSVLHDQQDREFSYVASTGDIRLDDGAIRTVSANVSLAADAGSITESAAGAGTAVKVTTAGTLTLSARDEIGGIGGTQAIDTAVAVLAAVSTSGDVSINEADNLVIGSGANGVLGVSSGGADVAIVADGGTIQIGQLIDAGSGSVAISGAAVTASANVQGQNLDIDSTGTVIVSAGSQLIASGATLTVDADRIELNAGSVGAGTVQNSGAGAISLNVTGTELSMDQFSILSGTGDVTIQSPTVNVVRASGSTEITSFGNVILNANTVGAASSLLELEGAAALSIVDSGAGAIFIGEQSSATINAVDLTVGDIGYGSIDIVYSNGDRLEIDDSHQIRSVEHAAGARSFEYTASLGNVSVESIDTSVSDVVLTASAGDISRSTVAVAPNVIAGTLTLSASGEIGGTATGPLQINVDTLAAESSASGGVFVAEVDGLTIGNGAMGISGVTSSDDRAVSLTSAGAVQVDRSIDAGAGKVTLSGSSIEIQSEVTGGDIDLDAMVLVNVASGSVVAGGDGTRLEIDAAEISLGAGSLGDQSVQNSGTGEIALVAATGNISLDHHAIGGGTGSVLLAAENADIQVIQPTSTTEVSLLGELTLTANAVGSASNQLELAGATSLSVNATGLGEIHLLESGASTITSVTLVVESAGAGLIDIEFDDSDAVQVGNNHSIDQVDLSASDRAFSYTATTGDITIDQVDTGIASVAVTSVDGSITESGSDAGVEITTAGILTLSSFGDIGGPTDGLSTDVGTLTARATGSGGIYVDDINGLIIGVDANGQSGLATSGGGIIIDAGAGALIVAQEINSSGGDLQLDAGGLTLNADVRGGSVALDSDNALSVTAGTRVIAGGDTTTLSVDAASVTILDGTIGDATLQNSGTGEVDISSSGDVRLSDHAIQAGTGSILIETTSGTIDENSDNANASITSDGQLTLLSNGRIGSSGVADDTQRFDVLVESISATVSGNGGVFIADLDGVIVEGISTHNGDVEIASSGDVFVHQAVTAGSSSDVSIEASRITMEAAGDLTASNGSISLETLSSGGLSFADDTVLTSSGGIVSGLLFNTSNPFSASSNIGTPLSDSNRIATINVALTDSLGTNVSVEVDWAEGDAISPVPTAPPENLRAQRVQADLASASLGEDLRHEYEDAPDPSNPSADINIGLSITELAGGAIQLLTGGVSLLQSAQFSAQFVTIEVSAPIFPLFIALPESKFVEQAAPVVQLAAIERDLQKLFVAETSQELSNSIGTTDENHQRYYVLRIVSFGEEGEVKLTQENQEYRLRDMNDPDGESGFELSQLPDLFKRLPDDRYRIYLVEGQTERLVLDFIIRDGQPIEAQTEEIESEVAEDNAPAGQVDSEEERQTAEAENTNDLKSNPAIETLGRSSILTSGGIVLAAGMFTQYKLDQPHAERMPKSKLNTKKKVTWL